MSGMKKAMNEENRFSLSIFFHAPSKSSLTPRLLGRAVFVILRYNSSKLYRVHSPDRTTRQPPTRHQSTAMNAMSVGASSQPPVKGGKGSTDNHSAS